MMAIVRTLNSVWRRIHHACYITPGELARVGWTASICISTIENILLASDLYSVGNLSQIYKSEHVYAK